MNISIIIPVYNRAKLIQSTLKSIIDQTYTNFECIIVDDFSTDNIQEDFFSWGLDHRFKLILNNRTKGAQGARNTGFIESKGEFICFFDSDNHMHPNYLDIMRDKLIKTNTNAVTCFSNLVRDKIRVGGMEFINDGNILKRLLLNQTYVDFNSLMVSREFVVNNIGLLDEFCVSHQELEFSIRLAVSTDFSCVKEYLVDYILDGDDRISSSFERGILGLMYIYLKYDALISIKKIVKIRLWLYLIFSYNKNCSGNLILKNQLKTALNKVNLKYLSWKLR